MRTVVLCDIFVFFLAIFLPHLVGHGVVYRTAISIVLKVSFFWVGWVYTAKFDANRRAQKAEKWKR